MYKNWNSSTRYIANTNYARMQNIQVGYTLPQNWLSKLRLETVRVYASGENLLTLTGLPNGIDPEIPNGAIITYGADRIYSCGLTVTF
jgi:hypothetical protein